MLFQIREYLRREKAATNQQLSRAFKIEESALQAMLDLWIKKGLVRLYQNSACKKTCFSCKTPSLLYTFNEK